jgi:hypothetical protein
VVIGNGNVALDVARILAKTGRSSPARTSSVMRWRRCGRAKVDTITLLGRRGPHQIAMTPKELGELGELERARPDRRSGRPAAARATIHCSIPGSANR